MVMLRKKTEERLGEILLKQGIISRKQLEQVIEMQKAEDGLFGEILIKLGYVNEHEIAQALISQYGFPFMPVENYTINPEAVKFISEKIARQYQVLPLDVIGDILVVAMTDPLNSKAIEDLEMMSKKKVQAFIGIMTSINKAISKLYGTGE